MTDPDYKLLYDNLQKEKNELNEEYLEMKRKKSL